MILELTYEEVTALNSAAERMRAGGAGGVAAPPEPVAALHQRLPIRGDIDLASTEEQERLLTALDAVLDHLRHRMESLILEQYVGAEDAVNAYFDYANVLTARHRLEEVGRHMRAVDDVIHHVDSGGSGSSPDASD